MNQNEVSVILIQSIILLVKYTPQLEIPKASHPLGSRLGSIFGDESGIRVRVPSLGRGRNRSFKKFCCSRDKGILDRMERDELYKPTIAKSAVRIKSIGQNANWPGQDCNHNQLPIYLHSTWNIVFWIRMYQNRPNQCLKLFILNQGILAPLLCRQTEVRKINTMIGFLIPDRRDLVRTKNMPVRLCMLKQKSSVDVR